MLISRSARHSDFLHRSRTGFERGLPFQGSSLCCIGEDHLLQRKRSFQQLDAQRLAAEFDGAVARSRGEKCLERTDRELRFKPERSLNCGVTEAGERTEQCIAGHGASIVIPTLIFIPWISTASVVAATQGLNDS